MREEIVLGKKIWALERLRLAKKCEQQPEKQSPARASDLLLREAHKANYSPKQELAPGTQYLIHGSRGKAEDVHISGPRKERKTSNKIFSLKKSSWEWELYHCQVLLEHWTQASYMLAIQLNIYPQRKSPCFPFSFETIFCSTLNEFTKDRVPLFLSDH